MGMALLVQERAAQVWASSAPSTSCPCALGLASASLLFWGFYSPSIGPIDPILQALGLTDEPIRWIGTPTMALFSTVVLIVWKFAGFFMLILLVGLQAIPTDVYEAARMDGANRWQTFSARHAAAAAAVPRAVPDHLGDRLAARVRPVLHPDQRRAGQLDDDRRAC